MTQSSPERRFPGDANTAEVREKRTRRQRSGISLTARGEPMLWLAGGALTTCLAMIAGILTLVLFEGLATFWPAPIVRIEDGQGAAWMGELTRRETIREAGDGGRRTRRLLRTGNFEINGTHYQWIDDASAKNESRPEWAMLLERVEWGRFYGFPKRLEIDGSPVAESAEAIWKDFPRLHAEALARREQRRRIESNEMSAINRRIETARIRAKAARIAVERKARPSSAELESAAKAAAEFERIDRESNAQFETLTAQIESLRKEDERCVLAVETAQGMERRIPLAEIVRAVPANRLGWWDKACVYANRWMEFLADEPREANSEGGVLPAIAGTVAMTFIMCVVVVPFGVLTALYLREYAPPGLATSAVRVAVTNLAGVPSIVFGVFGLGFFCYIIGANIDQLFFSANLPNPTYGKGGLLWASLTLALLTLPVVIVATEEAIAAVPKSMREGSFGCGASKWQTIHRIVLPQALPGIMTGVILAIARGAGEVAPLMLVGAVKLTHEWPVDAQFPFLHPTRSFMHLGFHVYDLGFQSPNAEAARPMVYSTTLLLIGIVALLNFAAIALRSRLYRRYKGSQF